jgi:kynureninase
VPVVVSRTHADELDRADPLRDFRSRFVPHRDPGRIYLNANSLGPLPRATQEHLAAAVAEEWGQQQVDGWDHWIDLSQRVGDALASAALGAAPGQVVVGDSTTVQLYKLASAALDARPDARAIVVPADEFPTDRYVLEGLAADRRRELRFLDADPVEGLSIDVLGRALAPGDVALVCLSLVSYRSGAIADMATVNRLVLDAGALALWDLSHAVGALDIALDADRADLAVGCTYKHLNAGPGAPAFAYVRRDLHSELRQPIQGWFGQRDQFAMGPGYDPWPDVRRFIAGTPPILGLVAVQSGVDLLAEAGVAAVRARSFSLTDLVVRLHDEWLAPLGFALGTPRDASRRGGHVSLKHPRAQELSRLLADRHSVITDFRPPDLIRIGPALLATRHTEIWDAFDRLRNLVAE